MLATYSCVSFQIQKNPGFLVMLFVVVAFRRMIKYDFLFPFFMQSSDFCMISRNLTRKYAISSDRFSAQGLHFSVQGLHLIPRAHTPSRARAANTHFGAFFFVHALLTLIPTPSFSWSRRHSCAFMRVRALPQHNPAP